MKPHIQAPSRSPPNYDAFAEARTLAYALRTSNLSYRNTTSVFQAANGFRKNYVGGFVCKRIGYDEPKKVDDSVPVFLI